MTEYRRVLISEGALLYALAALVNDVQPDLQKVVDASEKSPQSAIHASQVRNLVIKMSSRVQFTDNILSECLEQVRIPTLKPV